MITILGKGLFGIYIYNFFKKKFPNQVQVISLREYCYDINKILERIYKSNKVIDCMDRNIFDTDNYRINKIDFLRNEIFKLKSIFYIYISSCNLYKETKYKISEDNGFNDFSELSYEKSKILTEKSLINNLNNDNFLIARTPSLWFENMTKGSFMGDLINSYKSKKNLIPRNNDEKIISFIHIYNASEILYSLVKNECKGIYNITTNEWSSREELKLGINKINNISLGKRIISNRYNYQEFINTKIKLK